jgi:hypothetical protein
LRGVVPDIILPSLFSESKDIGENALEYPLPYDTIPSAKFDHLNLVAPCLPELRKRSNARLETEPEYRYIREDIQQFKKQQADKTISLNEKQRLKEKEEAEARGKARDKERLARSPSQEKVYELPLKVAALPGLPPPVAKTNSASAKLDKNRLTPGAISSHMLATAGTPGDSASADELDAEKPAPIDAPMVETEHILVDYLSVVTKKLVETAEH